MLKWINPLLWGWLLIVCAACAISSSPSGNSPDHSTMMPLPSNDASAATPLTTATQVFFPQLAPAEGERAFPEALMPGRLVLVDGCLRVIYSEDNTSYLIIWPPDLTLHVTGDTVQILNSNGQPLAQVGDMVQVGGGEIPPDAPIMQELRQPLPAECPGPHWLASGITP